MERLLPSGICLKVWILNNFAAIIVAGVVNLFIILTRCGCTQLNDVAQPRDCRRQSRKNLIRAFLNICSCLLLNELTDVEVTISSVRHHLNLHHSYTDDRRQFITLSNVQYCVQRDGEM